MLRAVLGGGGGISVPSALLLVQTATLTPENDGFQRCLNLHKNVTVQHLERKIGDVECFRGIDTREMP